MDTDVLVAVAGLLVRNHNNPTNIGQTKQALGIILSTTAMHLTLMFRKRYITTSLILSKI
ncbi:MAG: hypothetical protein HWQ38_36595 [Nostoc sp. NMS7]|uniref:hypothetical protein n=1 Tax=Nostoc sp. NMS7 TaxID=2815391 RepID=UPI0025F79B78|nr:hypothetical protein [Nostoc sp. NMS7]MBN3951687.1 hypothetical protein [Nostoc sp. NMS7]